MSGAIRSGGSSRAVRMNRRPSAMTTVTVPVEGDLLLDRPERRKGRQETLDLELVDPLGPVEVLEHVLAQIPQPDALSGSSSTMPGGGAREQRLPSACQRADPRGAMDGHAV